MARLENPSSKLTAEKMSKYVPKIDAMFTADQKFRLDLAWAFQSSMEHLKQQLQSSTSQSPDEQFSSLIATLEREPELKGDLFDVLIAMGFPGGTDTVRYVEWLYQSQQKN
jgi:hypothetical protein